MIVAIIDQTSPVGIVAVTTFVEAVDEAAGITQYVNFFVPPKTPGDWLGFDSGFVGGVTPPAAGKHWGYDFGTPGLVQVDNPAVDAIQGGYTLMSDEFVITSDAAWENIGGVVFDPTAYGNVAEMLMRTCGEYMSDVTGGTPQLRLVEDTTVIATANLPVAPTFTFASFDSALAAPTAGMHLYMLQGRLNGGTSATLRAGILQIIKQTT